MIVVRHRSQPHEHHHGLAGYRGCALVRSSRQVRCTLRWNQFHSTEPLSGNEVAIGSCPTSSQPPAHWPPIYWHGSCLELLRLLRALEHHCRCPGERRLGAGRTCPADAMLQDQRVVDHLLFEYRIRPLVDALNGV